MGKRSRRRPAVAAGRAQPQSVVLEVPAPPAVPGAVRVAALARLQDVAAHRAAVLGALEADLAVAVQQARRAGASWSHVGEVLGVSHESARRHYGEGAPS